MNNSLKKLSPVSWNAIEISGGFWADRQKTNRNISLPAVYKFSKSTGRIDCMKGLYQPDPNGTDILMDRANGKEEGFFYPDGTMKLLSLAELQGKKIEIDTTRAPRPHYFWDSDVAKWIEGAAYALHHEANPEVELIIDNIIDDWEKIQDDDGYLNTYFTFVEPGKRFTNIRIKHELYCLGHMIESAVAYYEATGKRKFLDMMIRYTDYVCTKIGPEEDQIHGYPGHQEIELALVKLYRVTGEEKYLKLSKYFLDERGQKPLFYDEECKREGENPNIPIGKGFDVRDGYIYGPYVSLQSYAPIREQKEALGHAVRMMYMCSGMADVAAESGDESLLQACKILWDNITLKKMYVTGGLGAESHGERFAFNYHLPNEEAYNETCAAIGLAMWAYRMLQFGADRKYADILERVIYNGVLDGLSASGDSFFYANHLACQPKLYIDRVERQSRMFPIRQKAFPVSCCPANITRFTESVSGYAMSTDENSAYFHLYMDSKANICIKDIPIEFIEKTEYPWDEKVEITVNPSKSCELGIKLRIPDWCENPSLSINGKELKLDSLENGYISLYQEWHPGDQITLILKMEPRLLEAHPSVRMDCGRVAIQYGPFIYCLEEIDNGTDLSDILLSKDSKFEVSYDPDFFGGANIIKATAKKRTKEDWDGCLYQKAGNSSYIDCEITAIPYYRWSNRKIGEMIIWIRYED